MFQDQLQPFIEWKTQKGFTVIEAYTDDPAVGSTTTSIKAFLQDLYDNATTEDPAPSFVLFLWAMWIRFPLGPATPTVT